MKRLSTIALVVLASCATGTYVPTRYFAIEVNVATEVASSTSSATLGVRPLSSATLYRQQIVRSRTPYVFEQDPKAQWEELPATILTKAITQALRATGHFADVADAAVMRAPTYLLTGQLIDFYERFDNGTRSAEAAIEIEVRQRDEGRTVLAKRYRASVAIPIAADPTAVAPAMSDAATQLVTQIAADVVQLP